MSSRSLNKVQLIGNLTRDPELRYTPQGTGVCTFGLATNRSWTTESGEKREDTEFHRVVAWNKLAELCSQLLFKGRKVYVEGRLQTRTWTGQDGGQRQTTEVVIEEMIILDNRQAEGAVTTSEVPAESPAKVESSTGDDLPPIDEITIGEAKGKKAEEKKTEEVSVTSDTTVSSNDIPF